MGEQHKDALACIEAMHRKDLRPKAERKAAEKAEKAGTSPPPITDADGHPEHLLYVCRQQTKAERQAVLDKQYGGKGASMTGFSSAKGSGKGKDTGKGKGTEPTTAAASALYSNSSVHYGSPVAPTEFMSYAAGR